jgi:hypothetical protein
LRTNLAVYRGDQMVTTGYLGRDASRIGHVMQIPGHFLQPRRTHRRLTGDHY